MSCLFCNSTFHVSHNCVMYATRDIRQHIAYSKNRCRNCLTSTKKDVRCTQCNANQKCYICFSNTHHTVYCPDWLTASKMFPPNIDKNLLTRFLELLKCEEKYSILFSYPNTLGLINLTPIKIIYKKQLTFSNVEEFSHANIIVADKAEVRHKTSMFWSLLDGIEIAEDSPSLPLNFFIRDLVIYHSPFTFQQCLAFLSYQTKSLYWKMNKNKLNFREILKHAPNLSSINLYETDIEVDNSWPDNLLEFNKAENFKYLCLPIPDMNFNIGSLVKFMKRKSTEFVQIFLYIILTKTENFDEDNAFEMVTNSLSNYFYYSLLNDIFKTRKQLLSISFTCKPGGINSRKYRRQDYLFQQI